MRVINWPGPVITKRSPDYEWAYMKAYLEGESNERSEKVYTEMFGEKPKAGVPFWLVRLAIYYGALSIGYARTKKAMPPREKEMLACVSELNEAKLRNNAKLMHFMRLHDFEDANFGGRELVS